MTSKILMTGAALGLALVMQAAGANEYNALIKAKKYSEAEKAATAKLVQDPANAEALAGKVVAILAAGNDSRVDEAIKLSEQCLRAHASLSICHLANGKAVGMKAMQGGMMAAMGSAGKIRDAFKRAVELDPRSMDARFSLLQFYVLAPGMMGGGVARAEQLVAETTALNGEAGKLMAGYVDLKEGRVAKAEAAAMAARPGADDELRERQEALLVNIAGKHMSDKKYGDAERVLREAARRFPDSDTPPYMIGRALQEQGKHREAISAIEPLLAKTPRAHMHYRIGQSQQALGETAKAAAAYERALAFEPALNQKLRAEAETRLKALKG